MTLAALKKAAVAALAVFGLSSQSAPAKTGYLRHGPTAAQVQRAAAKRRNQARNKLLTKKGRKA